MKYTKTYKVRIILCLIIKQRDITRSDDEKLLQICNFAVIVSPHRYFNTMKLLH